MLVDVVKADPSISYRDTNLDDILEAGDLLPNNCEVIFIFNDKCNIYIVRYWDNENILKHMYWTLGTGYTVSDNLYLNHREIALDVHKSSRFKNYIKNKGEIMLNTDTDLVGGDYKVVKLNGVSNYLKVDIDIDIDIGDHLVCGDVKNRMVVEKVIEIYENNIENSEIINKAKHWIIDKVYVSRQLARIEATSRREYIKDQLEQKRKSVEAIAIYDMLAKCDPEASKLLEELKKIEGFKND